MPSVMDGILGQAARLGVKDGRDPSRAAAANERPAVAATRVPAGRCSGYSNRRGIVLGHPPRSVWGIPDAPTSYPAVRGGPGDENGPSPRPPGFHRPSQRLEERYRPPSHAYVIHASAAWRARDLA